ncbi:YraN family protein [Shimia haliotis]|uniref:YraN family protein n=1 Tax=Shimia haliotis TaxID=1280847 RepID=UPI000B820B3A|nr:YraN family protein [Shimia haliotis]
MSEAQTPLPSRQRRGQRNYLAGQAAEASVARHYEAAGMTVAQRRWRGKAGEIDLVMRNGNEMVFVEVKKSRNFASASGQLQPRQMARLMRAAEEFVGQEPGGALTPMRFDVALMDDLGRIHILENALWAA